MPLIVSLSCFIVPSVENFDHWCILKRDKRPNSKRKEAYVFLFEFIRTIVHLNVYIKDNPTDFKRIVFNLIRDNERITKTEIDIRGGRLKECSKNYFPINWKEFDAKGRLIYSKLLA